jgi:hypothetical protein
MRFVWLVLSTVAAGFPGIPGVTGALAQAEPVRMTIEQGFAGLDGYIQPGRWTPIRLSVDHLSADDRDTIFRWELTDEDGDRVLAERRLTLTRQREGQPVWLYAPVPLRTNRDTRWTFRAIDAESGELLQSMEVGPDAELLVTEGQTLIGVTSASDLGLNDAARHDTSHAPIQLVRGLSLGRLPDRWHGLEALHALVWTQDLGDDPADPLQVSEAALAAVRQWVWRGGHLVVVLPQVGQTWGQSSLADLLPVPAERWRSVETRDWWRLDAMGGLVRPVGGGEGEPESMAVTTFDVPDDAVNTTVLKRDAEGRPVVVAARRGFGAVTLVGLDLTAAPVRRSGINLGQRRLWHDVFGWNWPLLTRSDVEREQRANRLYTASNLARQNQTRRLGRFISGQIAMTGTIGTLLVGGVVWFALYWVLTGWLLQPLLKRRGLHRFSWLAFLGLVLGFAAVTWGTAAVLRPTKTSLNHLTVLDFDGNQRLVRGQGYVSLFVPRFGTAEVATATPSVGPLPAGVHNLLSSPGFAPDAALAGFVDTQSYVLDAASPDAVALPVRSTTKPMRVQYLGPVDGDLPGLAEPFTISATQALELAPDGWPVGAVTHTLAGTLTNVQVIFCPGERIDVDGRRRQLPPQVWRYVNPQGENRWATGAPLELTGRPADYGPLLPPFRTWSQLPATRDWNTEGLLGRRFGELRGPIGDLPTRVDESVIARQFELLSFFDALPPPDLKRDPDNPVLSTAFLLDRSLLGGLDLTPLLRGRRVILLGQLDDSPFPLPLTVDGETPPSRGRTVVRWVYDF